MKRVAQVIRVGPETYDEYVKYHEDVWPGVAAKIDSCNIRNYSIYHYYGLLFAYFEYVGEALTETWRRWPRTPKPSDGGTR